jgi:hypothetical protein
MKSMEDCLTMKYLYKIEEIALLHGKKLHVAAIHIDDSGNEREMKSGFVASIEEIPTMIKEMENE